MLAVAVVRCCAVMADWWVYMIRADDDTLYTGVTTDIARRFHEHCQGGNTGKGARYFNGRRPDAVVYTERQPNRSAALRREVAIKRLTRTQKMDLLQDCLEYR